MEKSKSALVVIILLLLLPSAAESTGVFGGFDIDNEGQIFSYVGGVTEGTVFAHVLAGYQRYEFKDNGEIREVNSFFVTPAIGLKSSGPLSVNLSVGPTVRDKEEEEESGYDRSTEVGGTVQVGGYLWRRDHTFDALASFSTLDAFFWGRMRGTKRIANNLYGGGEIFWMGNDDFEGWGAGPVMVLQMKKLSLGLKMGYKNTSTFDDGFYVGCELYTSF
jgi:hypothetical protein